MEFLDAPLPKKSEINEWTDQRKENEYGTARAGSTNCGAVWVG